MANRLIQRTTWENKLKLEADRKRNRTKMLFFYSKKRFCATKQTPNFPKPI
jgi:hypothetical protein